LIRSMTGFGRSGFDAGGMHFDVEIRTLNARHLDVSVRLPKSLSAFEAEARALVQASFGRGKADLSVSLPAGASPAARVEIDLEVADRYVDAARRLAERHGLSCDLGAAEILALPSVTRIVESEVDPESLRAGLGSAVREAIAAALAMRRREGESLVRELRGRLERIESLAAAVEERSGSVQAAVHERLRKRAEQLRSEIGSEAEARIAHEIVLAADRLDVTEELVRLRSHIGQFTAILGGEGRGPDEPAGRGLEFLLQELAREANTIGSKGSDAPIAHLVVELKTELERLREQVLNVE
jgi:uncharacterized protein (TIGR00255 family)